MALEILPWLEEEAAERIGGRPRIDDEKPSQKIDSVSAGKSTEQAARLVSTNRQYVADMKQISSTIRRPLLRENPHRQLQLPLRFARH